MSDFDPDIHVTDDDGNPVKNQDGTLRKMNAGQQRSKRTRRRRRKEFGPQQTLKAEKREGYVRRWFNDERGRIEQYTQQDDWDLVQENGQPVRRQVGEGRFAVLLEKPREYYEEDLREKRKLIPDPAKTAEAKIGPGEYAPDGHNSALR
jgi:hypothetical protein